MVAILTKYIGPTNHRGSRVKAYTDQGRHSTSVTISWDDALNPDQNHRMAALTLAEKMAWVGQWVCGGTEKGYAFICVERSYGDGFTVRSDGKVKLVR